MIQNGLVSAMLKWPLGRADFHVRHGPGVRQFIEVAQKFAGEVSTKLSTNCSDGVLADYASIRHVPDCVPDIFGEFLRGNRTVLDLRLKVQTLVRMKARLAMQRIPTMPGVCHALTGVVSLAGATALRLALSGDECRRGGD